MKYKIGDVVLYKGERAKIKDVCLSSSKNDYLLDNLAYVKEDELKYHYDNYLNEIDDNTSDLKFEISYFWNNTILYRVRYIKNGIKNLINWFPVIWDDRWYDEGYIIKILKFKLLQTAKSWDDCHYCQCEKEQEFLYEVIC